MSIHLRLRRPVRRLWYARLARRGSLTAWDPLVKISAWLTSLRSSLRRAGVQGQPGIAPLASTDVVVVDVETTGWLADAARITEIGAVRLAGGQLVAEFSALINPQVQIPANITALTGISDEMVKDAPVIGEVLPRFLDFASNSVIVAHNAPFDLGFLSAACASCGIAWSPGAVIDTAVLARLVLRPGEVVDHKLTTLAAHFRTRTDPCHRALADAQATAGVLGGLLRLVQARAAAAQSGAATLPRNWRPRWGRATSHRTHRQAEHRVPAAPNAK